MSVKPEHFPDILGGNRAEARPVFVLNISTGSSLLGAYSQHRVLLDISHSPESISAVHVPTPQLPFYNLESPRGPSPAMSSTCIRPLAMFLQDRVAGTVSSI